MFKTKRYHLNSHKSILNIGIDFDKLTKNVTCSFLDFKAEAPRIQGVKSTTLIPLQNAEELNAFEARKFCFLEMVKSLWVRSVTIYDDYIEVIFW